MSVDGEPEEWRDVAGYEGLYQVSSLGRVRSLDRVIVRSDGQLRRLSGRVLSLTTDTGGYPQVSLYGAGRRRTALVHHLVAEAWHGPRPDGQDTRHLDGDPTNNHPENLCYSTHAENMADMSRHGTLPRGAQNGNVKLTAEIVLEARRRYARGETRNALALEFGVSGSAMGRAIVGRTWKHLPGAVATKENNSTAGQGHGRGLDYP